MVSIVGVEPETIKLWIKKNYRKQVNSDDEIIDFMNTPEVKVRFLKNMNEAVGNSVQGFERVHNIRIGIEPMRIEDDVITSTMKIKRAIASKFFSKELKEMYDEGSLLRAQETKL